MEHTCRVVDAHTHLFPPDVASNRQRYLDRDEWFGELYASPRVEFVTPEQLIASMDEAGIEKSVVCGWPWKDPGLCREHNDYMADVARRFPDRIAWLSIVNPVEKSVAGEVVRATRLGASGVGELNADAQGFSWDDTAALGNLVEACLHLDIPILMHCSEPVGHAYPGKGTATPDRILHFLGAFPELKVVAAHWGGGLPFYELMPEVAKLTRNVVYDSAASTYLYRFDIFPVVGQLIGAGRVVFGTDYPLLRQKSFLSRVLESGLPSSDFAGVLGATAIDIFKLDRKGLNS